MIAMLHLDDDQAYCDWTRVQLARYASDILVRDAASFDIAMDILRSTTIDCLLSNDEVAGDDGTRLLQQLRESGNHTPFIMLSDTAPPSPNGVDTDTPATDEFTVVIALGDVKQIVHWAYRLVGSQRQSPHSTSPLSNEPAHMTGADTAPAMGFPQLTSREEEVLRLITRGLSNKEIAAELGISYNTVVNHVRNMFAKLGIHSRAEAIHMFHRVNSGDKL